MKFDTLKEIQCWMMTKQCSSESHKSKVKIGLLQENLILENIGKYFSSRTPKGKCEEKLLGD